MAENGRPTELTEELTLRIRSMVLEGKRYSEVQRELDISPNTWDTWVYKDYQDFRKNLNSWKAERLIKKSEKISEEILDMENVTAELLRIKQKEAEFVRETLGKQEYSKRSELTGKDGKDLIPKPIYNGESTIPICGHASNEEDISIEEKD